MDSRFSRAWVEVDLDALVANAQTLISRSGKPLLPMVKADGYGLGAVRVCRALQPLKPWAFGVAALSEAEELRAAGIETRILIFTPVLPDQFEDVRRLRVVPTLGQPELIKAWVNSGGGAWHLAIDTGMHRAGIEWWRVNDVVELVRAHPPQGAFTHLHSADANDGSMALQQQRFVDAVGQLPARPATLHVENSPGLERQAPSPWDVVRPGVFLYGVGGGEGSNLSPKPVAHLRARIVELHEVRAGEGVSYGGTWRPPEPRRVATLSVGYGDGYRRAFSNCGYVLLNGKRAPVVGRVTMDMTVIDVTDVPCATGDVATLIGTAGDDQVDINRLSEDASLLAYEVLTGLKLRAPRIYVGADA